MTAAIATVAATSVRPPDAADGGLDAKRIRETAQEFEAVLVASMLKEGLKSSAASAATADEESDGTQQPMLDFVYEQMAYHIGKQGVLGISDAIAERLRQAATGGKA